MTPEFPEKDKFKLGEYLKNQIKSKDYFGLGVNIVLLVLIGLPLLIVMIPFSLVVLPIVWVLGRIAALLVSPFIKDK